MHNKNIDYFFKNIKDGDIVGFYRSGLLSYVIRFFQDIDKSNNVNKVCHCGVIYEVKRKGNRLSFMLSHQTGSHGGLYEKWEISRYLDFNKNFKYKIMYNTKYTDFYYLELSNKFNSIQIKKGIKDAISQIGKVYGYFSFITSIPFISTILGKLTKNPLAFSNLKRVCSKHVLINASKANRNVINIIDDNPFPTPEYILTCNKYDLSGSLFKIVGFKDAL